MRRFIFDNDDATAAPHDDIGHDFADAEDARQSRKRSA
jgi:hypothetical protein